MTAGRGLCSRERLSRGAGGGRDPRAMSPQGLDLSPQEMGHGGEPRAGAGRCPPFVPDHPLTFRTSVAF